MAGVVNSFFIMLLVACCTALQAEILQTEPLQPGVVDGEAEPVEQSATEPSGDSEKTESPALLSPLRWLKAGGSWMLDQRESFSEKVQDTAVGLDRYISRDSFDEDFDNESYMRLRLINRFIEAGEIETEGRISGKIDLPNSRQNTKLIFDTDPDDFDTLENKQRGVNVGTSYKEDKSKELIAGLQFIRTISEDWTKTTSAGIKLRSGLDPFARMRFTRQDELTDNWQYRLRETFFFYHTDGWGAETESDFYRALTMDKLLDVRLAGKYLDSDNNWEWLNSVSLNERLGQNNAMQYQVGVSANSQPVFKASNYWFRTTWQHRLYEDWLYFKVVPEVAFEREDDFSSEFSISFELEVFFSNHELNRNNSYVH